MNNNINIADTTGRVFMKNLPTKSTPPEHEFVRFINSKNTCRDNDLISFTQNLMKPLDNPTATYL